ncbi:unnamed protein product, partial [Sphacelaria rigidula]
GAIAVYASTILVEEGTVFSGNSAISGAGGGIYCSLAVASFRESIFTANEAIWGGGLALFSSGFVWNAQAPDTSGPANVTLCVFDRNKAVDGGAMYSVAGYDMINNSSFEENRAEGSGGAYLHSGVLVGLRGSTFAGNRAGDDGLAIMSHGMVELDSFENTSFRSNTYYCPSGQYGYEVTKIGGFEDEVSGTCRFDLVWEDCPVSCEEIPESIDVLNDSFVPTCETAMTGVDASGDGGMTLSMLKLDHGYYRTSVESHEVLRCHQENACIGGAETSQYCETGYQGPYCAVCEEGYASGYQYSCSSCFGENKRSAMGTSIALLLVALVIITMVIANLIRVLDENSTDTASILEKRLTSCRERIANIIPLTSIKIVVVVWQIVTQFSSVVNVVYPDVYERFLSALNLVNLNLGFILSVSCIVDINFYGQLVFVTISPLVVAGVLAGTYAVSRSRNRHSPAGMQAAKHKHLSIALLVAYFIYSSVSFTIFQTFVCEPLDDGMKYLRADYSLTCSTGIHTAMQVYAGLMIFVYPVGIPAFFAWWLISHRHDLVKVGSTSTSSEASRTLDHLQPMRDLWDPYKPRRYYYEVVECCRRIALTGLAVFLLPGSAAQVAIEVVLAAVFIALSEKLSPFADPLDAWLYRCGVWVVFFSMYLCLLLKVDASDEDSRSQVEFAKVLITAHVCMVLMVAFQAVLSLRRGLDSVRNRRVANQRFRGSRFAQV